jgi:hypothetical protein
MFLTAIFGAIDDNPYQKMGEYLDDGVYPPAPTGSKQVDVNGQTVFYGPTVAFTKTTTPQMVTIEFADPKPQAALTKRCRATIERIEFEAGGDTYAVGDVMGVVQRKKLTWQ